MTLLEARPTTIRPGHGGGTVATPGLRIERLGPAFGAIVHGIDLGLSTLPVARRPD